MLRIFYANMYRYIFKVTRGEESCTKANPLFWPVCLSLIRRMLFDERLAYGASAVIMASTVVRGAIFLRMIAVQKKSVYVRISYFFVQRKWVIACKTIKDKSLLSPQKSPLGWDSEAPVLLLASPSAERTTEKLRDESICPSKMFFQPIN